jgi:aryl-alcohol dehydrogenase-like predicted oxidoreductase
MTELPITLGGNTFGWTSDREESFAVLDAFTSGGGSLVDTADMYSQWGEGLSGGESETVLGEWFAAGNRDKVRIATKVGAIQSAPGLAHDVVDRNLDDSLTRLQTDHIDLYYYHYDDESVSIADQVATAAELVESGRVGRIALSNYTPDRMREFFRLAADGPAAPAAIQPQYSLLARAGFENNYRPVAEEFGVAVYSYFSLASGLLTGKYRSRDDIAGAAREGQTTGYFGGDADPFAVVEAVVKIAQAHGVEPASVALAWLRSRGVTAPIASARTAAQVGPLLASATLELTSQDVAELDLASAEF